MMVLTEAVRGVVREDSEDVGALEDGMVCFAASIIMTHMGCAKLDYLDND